MVAQPYNDNNVDNKVWVLRARATKNQKGTGES